MKQNIIVEILDYWRQLYKDPQLGIEERNKILTQIREIYLQYEDLLTHFKYDVMMIDEDEDDKNSSSSEEENEDSTRKRKSEEPLDLELFGDYGINEDFIYTGDIKTEEKASTSQSSDTTQTPTLTMPRRDANNKYPIAQNGVYLDLSHVPFKDQERVIDDWAQSMSILITNYKSTWSKEKFLDYIAATLQGDALQWLRQWEKNTVKNEQKKAL